MPDRKQPDDGSASSSDVEHEGDVLAVELEQKEKDYNKRWVVCPLNPSEKFPTKSDMDAYIQSTYKLNLDDCLPPDTGDSKFYNYCRMVNYLRRSEDPLAAIAAIQKNLWEHTQSPDDLIPHLPDDPLLVQAAQFFFDSDDDDDRQ